MMSRLKILIASSGQRVMAAASKGLVGRTTDGKGLPLPLPLPLPRRADRRTMVVRRVFNVAAAVLLVALFASTAVSAQSRGAAGIGPSTARPEGPVFELPAGLELQQPALGHEDSACRLDDDTDPIHLGPPESSVLLCLAFVNTTGAPMQVRLPAGLVFISRSETTQNGLLIQVETFEAPPGSFFVKVNLLCLNSGRSSSGPGDAYELGPVLEPRSPVWELIDALASKSIDSMEARAPSRMQAALWNITDGDGLTSVDRSRIAQLPPLP